MEGNNISDDHLVRQQQNQQLQRSQPIKSDKKIPTLFIISLVIGIILLIVLISAYLISIPEWQRYDMHNNGEEIVWENRKLDTQIRKFHSIDMFGNDLIVYEAKSRTIVDLYGNTPTELLHEVYANSNSLTADQISWYEYMCENVVE